MTTIHTDQDVAQLPEQLYDATDLITDQVSDLNVGQLIEMDHNRVYIPIDIETSYSYCGLYSQYIDDRRDLDPITYTLEVTSPYEDTLENEQEITTIALQELPWLTDITITDREWNGRLIGHEGHIRRQPVQLTIDRDGTDSYPQTHSSSLDTQ